MKSPMIIFRCHNLDLHDRLKQLGQLAHHLHGKPHVLRFQMPSPRINVMRSAIIKRRLKVDASGNRNRSVSDALRRPFSTPGINSVARYHQQQCIRTEALTLVLMAQTNLDTRILTRTTRLLLMGVINFINHANRFTVSHLRRTNVSFNLEFTLHAINKDVEVQAHPYP